MYMKSIDYLNIDYLDIQISQFHWLITVGESFLRNNVDMYRYASETHSADTNSSFPSGRSFS